MVGLHQPGRSDYWKNRVSVTDLDGLSNKIAVAYTDVKIGRHSGERGTTGWASDEVSISEYGMKELLLSMGGVGHTAAEQMRDIALSQSGATASAGVGRGGGQSVKIECRGWWRSLEWRYCAVPVELAEGFHTIGSQVDAGRDG